MVTKHNSVFIATSLDGFIADKNGEIDWLNSIPNPENNDMGYNEFISRMDAIVMGKNTFETICGFNIDWPYKIPVFVLSKTLNNIPDDLENKVHLLKGPLGKTLKQIHQKGYYRLYIDGGKTIQNFLKEDLIDELIISIIPTILGGGIPLFSDLPVKLDFECYKSKLYLNEIAQNYYRRINRTNS